MFRNVEKKIKSYAEGLALTSLLSTILLSLLLFIAGINVAIKSGDEQIAETVIFLIIVAFLFIFLPTLILAWFIYAFADMLENMQEVNHTLKIAFAKELKQEEEAQQKAQMEAEAEKARMQAEEEARAEKRKAYWDKYPDDYTNLLTKQETAKKLLRKNLPPADRLTVKTALTAIQNELELNFNDESDLDILLDNLDEIINKYDMKYKKRKAKIIVVALVAIGFIFTVFTFSIHPYITYQKYQNALSLMEIRDYTTARQILESLADANYEDSAEILKECIYQQAFIYMEEKKYDLAEITFGKIKDYKNSSAWIAKIKNR